MLPDAPEAADGPKRTWPKPRVRLVDLERADADVHTGDREALTPPARCAMHAFACLTNGSSVCGNFRQARKRLMNRNDRTLGRPGWPRNPGHVVEFGT